MIIDLQSTFSGTTDVFGVKTGQPITATAISQNVLDLRNGAAPSVADEGISGPEMWLVVQLQSATNGADAAKTLTITLESDVAVTLASAPVVHFTTVALTGAQLNTGLTAGQNPVQIQIPSTPLYKRYLGLRYTVSAGFTSFPVLAFLTFDVSRIINYPTSFALDV